MNETRTRTVTPSVYQQAIYDWIERGTGNGVIEAVAGSGKTTTIVNALKLVPTNARVGFLAFNRSIAEELKRRVPANVEAMTLNGMGHRAWLRYAGRVQVDANKTRSLMQLLEARLESNDDRDLYFANRFEIGRMVAAAKAAGVGVPGMVADRADVWAGIIEHHALDVEPADLREVIAIARAILADGIAMKHVIDFDDQLFMTAHFRAPLTRYDWLFVDEAQDLSPIQHELLGRALKPGGRLVAVGDSNQAIYGFRGADADSMDRIRRTFNAVSLPLSISYRCPRNVVAAAKALVPHIEPAATAPDGEVYCMPAFDASAFAATDLVVCRNTKPLIKLAYALIGKRVPVRVMGREIGNGLVSLINKIDRRKGRRNVWGERGLVERLDRWLERETAKYAGKGQDDKADLARDRYDTIMVFIEETRAESVEKLVAEIVMLFSDDKNSVRLTLATIHKAKGLEADRVFFLDAELLPSRHATMPWQMQQERNLEYVAITRAKAALVYIKSGSLVAGDVRRVANA